ncbi:MAG: 1-phosphofructokinase [Ignavibacteriaceae bacterium]|nr:1-phosphofructokinase [Ignavibacteriaceae bacterium]
MILTVTANPLLELVYIKDTFEKGRNNRAAGFLWRAGGKGINISRQLSALTTHSVTFLPLGGETGKILRSVLEQEKLTFSPVSVKSPVRTASILQEEHSITSAFSTNIPLSSSDIAACIDKLAKMIVNVELVSFSGSVPSEEAAEIYREGIRLAKKYAKVCFLDTYGNHLINCLKESPTVVHVNADEILPHFNSPPPGEEGMKHILSELYSYGVKQAYITDGANPFYASNFNYHFKVTPPPAAAKDATGSGDAFLAGIIYGWYNDMVFQESLRLAVALGTANACTIDICRVPMHEALTLTGQVIIEPVGQKMKLIDDAATFH